MKPTQLDMHASKGGGGGGGGGEWLHKNGCHNHLELRLGVSRNDNGIIKCNGNDSFADTIPAAVTEAKGDTTVGKELRLLTNLGSLVPYGGTPRRLPGSAAGFIHPWSLAARQQKAVLEQPHHLSIPSSSTVPRFTPAPPVIGWPPVRAFRRSLIPTKPEMEGERDAKKSKVTQEEQKSATEVKPTLFVKVNMEGLVVGRKINLKAHDSYDSLSRTLQKMFNNFLSTDYSTNASEEEQDDHSPNLDYILLYEDHEGDCMLVGDVPWQMFINTVKRLYIAHNPKIAKHENGNNITGNGKAVDGEVEQ